MGVGLSTAHGAAIGFVAGLSMTASETRNVARQRQLDWLDRLIRETGLSASAIATRAGLMATTLTRFRDPEQKPDTLSAATIEKIAQHFGVAGPDGGRSAAGGFGEREGLAYVYDREPALDRVVRAVCAGRTGVDPWVLRSHALEDAGFLAGDILFVDLNATPRDGDVVCAQVYKMGGLGADTVFRIYRAHPPILIAATRRLDLARPLMVDNNAVMVRGVVEGSWRPRLGDES